MENKKELSVLESLSPNENSLNGLVLKYKEKLLKRASITVKNFSDSKKEQFFARTITSILKDEKLRECFNSIEGKVSIYSLIDTCLQTGLELQKHAYAIPYSRKLSNGTWVKEAKFMPKKEGYHAMLCGGDKPIFKDLKCRLVYEKDNVEIEQSLGEVIHNTCVVADPGKIIGAWVQAIKLDGTKEVKYYSISYIYNIRDNHSKSYQDFIAKKINSTPWVTDEPPMVEKTALKSFCRPYADVKEELEAAYYAEGDYVLDTDSDIEDVANVVIDEAIDKLDEKVDDVREDVQKEAVNINEEPKIKNKKTMF